MMSRQQMLCLGTALMLSLWCFSPAVAQSPGVLYTWDQSYGEAVGANVEGWSVSTSAAAIDNSTDGLLTITEVDQTGYSVYDNWNRIRETTNPLSYSGLDLTGLEAVEFDVAHNGTETYSGKLFMQTSSAWHDIAIDVAPGATQTFSMPLSSLSADEIPWVRTVGLQVYDHTWSSEGPLTWTISEVRSAGTPLMERYLSPHAPGDLDGAVVNFGADAISGGSGGTQNGLSMDTSDTDGGALRWIDLGGGSGAAIAWANGRDGYLAKDYRTRAMDLSNYQYVDVRIKANPGTGADDTLGVQFYTQAGGWSYHTVGDQYLDVDNQWHVMTFPLAGVPDMDEVDVHGINLYEHEGNMQMFVDYVRFYSVPEPASVLMLLIGCVGLLGMSRKRG